MTLPFTSNKQGISKNESGIGENDTKIDTSPDNDDEAREQEKAKEIMEINNFNENIDDDTSGDESEDEEESDEDDSKDEEEESDESEEEESEEESDESNKETEDKEDANQDNAPKWQKLGFESAEKYADHLEEKLNGEQKVDYSDPEKQKQTMDSFFDKHSDVIPNNVKENYTKFWETGNATFLHIDNELHKLITALEEIKDTVPLNKRLEYAFGIAFPERISKNEQKKGEVRAEIRTQKVNKSTSQSVGGNRGKSAISDLLPEQEKVFERFGLKPDAKLYKN